MLRLALPALLLAGFQAAPAALAMDLTCPPAPASAAAPSGWSLRTGETRYLRAPSVGLYGGDPEQRGSLVPDDGDDDSSAVWTLYADRGPFWLTCHYPGTPLTLARELPAATRLCRADYGHSGAVRAVSCE